MAAVILVLAADIGDTYRGPFVGAVVRAISALTNEEEAAMNPQSGGPALPVTGIPTNTNAVGQIGSGFDAMEVDESVDTSIDREEGDVMAPPLRGSGLDMPTVIGSPSSLPRRGRWGPSDQDANNEGEGGAPPLALTPSASAEAPSQPPSSPQPPAPLPPSRDIHLLVAGSKRHASHLNVHDAVPANLATGGTYDRQMHRSEWDRAWTSGEQVFADIVNGVGIEKFGPRTNLWAQLMDVGKDAHGVGVLEELGREIELKLKRKWCDGVSVVYMLVPPRSMTDGEEERAQTAGSSSSEPERHRQLVQDMDLGRIKQTFEEVWARGVNGDGKGIMRQTRIEFVTSTKYN